MLFRSIWIDAEQKLSEPIALTEGWQAVQKDYLQANPFTAPGKITGKYLIRPVKLPAHWQGKPVYLHLDTAQQWLGSVVINGQPINYSAFLHPFGLRAEINLEPYCKAGETNTIELWPYKTIPQARSKSTPNPSTDDAVMDVKRVFIGVGSEER